MRAPLISVILPIFNHADLVVQALESIRAQEYGDFELIIVNDGSTDLSKVTIAEWRFRAAENLTIVQLESDRNSGTPAAPINAGVEYARGEWITWVSADNTYAPNFLSELVVQAIAHKAAVVYSGFQYNVGGRATYMFTPHTPDAQINTVNCYYGLCFLVRADVWREAGPHRHGPAHDYDHWLRIEEVCFDRGLKILGIDQSLGMYRAHDNRVSARTPPAPDAAKWQALAKKRRGIT